MGKKKRGWWVMCRGGAYMVQGESDENMYTMCRHCPTCIVVLGVLHKPLVCKQNNTDKETTRHIGHISNGNCMGSMHHSI